MGSTRYYGRYEGMLVDNKFAVTDDAWKFLSPDQTVRGTTVPVVHWELGGAEVQNRSGGAAAVGVGVHVHPSRWIAGTLTSAGVAAPFTDDTADAQSAAVTDFPLETTTNDSGHLLACAEKFNLICYTVGTASASGPAPVRTILYSAADGTMKTIGTGVWYVGPPTGAIGAEWAYGERAIWFPTPGDFVPADSRHTTQAVLWGNYVVIVRATTAPTTTAGVASQVTLGYMTQTKAAVANNGTADFDLGGIGAPVAGAHLAFAVSQDTDTANVANTGGSFATILAHPRG